MKIAICFYGQPRRYSEVLNKWKKIISEFETDIFIHTWFGEDRGRKEINIENLIKDFYPKEIKISNPHKFTDIIPTDSKYESQSYHAIQQSYSITNSLNLLKKFQNDLNVEYDFIIKSRMDIDLHNVEGLINFLKNSDKNQLYVSGNHWNNSKKFDDNLMISNPYKIKTLFCDFYNFTINYIQNTKIIPSGETNHYNLINSKNFINDISKNSNLNFDLLGYKLNEIIINENEK